MMKTTGWCWVSGALCCAVFTFTARASVIEETLTLNNGWNAVYLESTPETSEVDAFFTGLPGVIKVACHVSSVYQETAQYDSEGSEIVQKPVSFFLWERGKSALSTLKNLAGGHVYLIYSTNACTRTFMGAPCVPQVSWQATDGGFMTLAGVSIPAGEQVSSAIYFQEGPCGAIAAAVPYEIGGVGTAPEYFPLNFFSSRPKVDAGRAYAFSSEKAMDWSGVLEVNAGLSGALDFGDGEELATVKLTNAGTTNRTIAVALTASARTSDVMPALKLYVPPTAYSSDRWEAFSATNVTLDAGKSVELTFSCDKSAMTDPSKVYGAVLGFSDLSGTKMRVRIPVTAMPDTVVEGRGAFPVGLWIGLATISQVSTSSNREPQKAGGSLKATVLVHVPTNGPPVLLQRVAVARVADEEGGSTYHDELYHDIADVPAGITARRISSLILDTANREVAAVAGSRTFGNEVAFHYVISEHSPENPFRHTWHPDHDGKKADYSGPAPSGDSPANFIGPIKPESFSITNEITFIWRDAAQESTFEKNADESTYGRVDWCLGGLREMPIYMRGTFVLKRLSSAVEIK